jgi:hypothetical protein
MWNVIQIGRMKSRNLIISCALHGVVSEVFYCTFSFPKPKIEIRYLFSYNFLFVITFFCNL